jgi:hypothetical protein
MSGLSPTEYSIHPKAGLSAFQMAFSRTLFGSGFQMVKNKMAAILLKPFENRTFCPAFEWQIPFESRTG